MNKEIKIQFEFEFCSYEFWFEELAHLNYSYKKKYNEIWITIKIYCSTTKTELKGSQQAIIKFYEPAIIKAIRIVYS
jgi:hypothetical protein